MTKSLLLFTLLITVSFAHDDHNHSHSHSHGQSYHHGPNYIDDHMWGGHYGYPNAYNAISYPKAAAPIVAQVPQVVAQVPQGAQIAFPSQGVVSGVQQQHNAVALPVLDVFPPAPRKEEVKVMPKPIVFKKPMVKPRALYKDKALPYMPGFKWNTYTNQREE